MADMGFTECPVVAPFLSVAGQNSTMLSFSWVGRQSGSEDAFKYMAHC